MGAKEPGVEGAGMGTEWGAHTGIGGSKGWGDRLQGRQEMGDQAQTWEDKGLGGRNVGAGTGEDRTGRWARVVGVPR